MKKHIFSAVLATLFQVGAIAQLTLQTNIPTLGLIQKNQLWNVLVINSSTGSYDCKLNLTLKDRATGQDVLTGSTGPFYIKAGATQLNVNVLNPIQYNYISTGIDTRIQGILPAGTYIACYTLSMVSAKVDLAEECIQFDVVPLSPPMLTFPADSAVLENAPTQFVWMPPTPVGMFSSLHYEILIVPINEGQKAEEAIEQNLPFYSDGNVLNNILNYTASSINFGKDQWYAWQVIARDDKSYAGKSETWVFNIPPVSIIKMIEEQAPFLKMKKSNPEKGIAPNGILKFSYVNETTDSIAQINIIELNNRSGDNLQFTIALQPGENLIQYNLKKKFHLEDGKIYEAQIINSRKERWRMQFEIHFYESKKSSHNQYKKF
jgi:hypothetical protein